jgi:hypothetical protein
MTELKMEHVLLLAVAAFLLYHFIGGCGCSGNGFNVGCQNQKSDDFVKEMFFLFVINNYIQNEEADNLTKLLNTKSISIIGKTINFNTQLEDKETMCYIWFQYKGFTNTNIVDILQKYVEKFDCDNV